MRTTPISDIIIEGRQRESIEPKPLEELKRSILSKGLLHAPVMSTEADGRYKLRAGERRLRAIQQLHEENHTIKFNGEAIPTDEIPFVLVTELDEADLQEVELEENL